MFYILHTFTKSNFTYL